MGALDDLIAQAQGGGGGGRSELDDLMARAQASDVPTSPAGAQPLQLADSTEPAPSFVSFDPTKVSPPPAEDVWSKLGAARERLLNGPAQQHMADMERKVAESGVTYRTPRASDAYFAGSGLAGPAGQAVSTGARLAAGAGSGLAAGVAEQFRNIGQSDKSVGARAADALIPAAVGAGGALAARGAQGVAGGLDWAKRKARNVVAGGNAATAKDILKKLGPNADVDLPGRLLERYSPSPLTGRSAAGHLEQSVAPQLRDEGIHHGNLLRQAGEAEGINRLIPGEWRQAGRDLAGSVPPNPIGGQARSDAAALANVAQDVSAAPPPATLGELAARKSALQASGAGGRAFGVADTASAQADAAAGSRLRAGLENLMSQASPDTNRQFLRSRDVYRDLSTLRQLLAAKNAAEQSGGDIGTTIASTAIGAGIGGLAGAATGRDPVTGAVIGAGTAAGANLGLTGGATRTAVRQFMGTRGADLGANIASGLSRAAAATGRGLQAASVPAAIAAGGFVQSRRDREMAPGADVAVGQKRVTQVVKTNPQALGAYAPQLMSVADDPARLEAKIANLSRSDEGFRALVDKIEREQQQQQQPGITYGLER